MKHFCSPLADSASTQPQWVGLSDLVLFILTIDSNLVIFILTISLI